MTEMKPKHILRRLHLGPGASGPRAGGSIADVA